MKIRYFIPVLITVVAFTTTNSYATSNPVPEAVKKLYIFLGNWKGKATSTANGQSQTFGYTMDFKTDAAGWSILYHEKGDIPNATPYLGVGMLAADQNDNTVHIFTVSNYGDVHDHKGTWTDDKHFSLVYNGTSEGKTLKEELSVEYIDVNTFKFSDMVTIDGKTIQTLTAEMHKTSVK